LVTTASWDGAVVKGRFKPPEPVCNRPARSRKIIRGNVDLAPARSSKGQKPGSIPSKPSPARYEEGDKSMRFMVIVKATNESEAGVMGSEELLSAMAKFNEEMVKAGIMLDGNGLQPSSKGARIRFSGDKRTVIDGPFAETKELVAGYWIIQVKSKQEAIEWMKRCPNPHPDSRESEIEIRQLFELEDFGESEGVEHHRRIADEMAKKN
jgi:hypothetical protein